MTDSRQQTLTGLVAGVYSRLDIYLKGINQIQSRAEIQMFAGRSLSGSTPRFYHRCESRRATSPLQTVVVHPAKNAVYKGPVISLMD
jgi:hypothetical protein